MESMHSFLEELAKRAPKNVLSPEQQLEKMLRSSSYLQQFCEEHPDVTRDDLLRSLSTVYEAVKENYYCEHCPGLERCPNLVKGHFARLEENNRHVVSKMVPCDKQLAHEENLRTRRLVRSYHVSEETLNATFQAMEPDEANQEAIKAAIRFCRDMTGGKSPKGLYLHGPFGVGKSYLMGAIAHELSRNNIASVMVYMPDFVRELKESIADQSYAAKVELLKGVPVLILDDIGAENLTPWVRDEIIGVILYHRVSNRLPTLYTSNYSLEELEEHLAISNGNRMELTKARRIMERIIHYAEVYLIEGGNRRKEGTLL